MKQTKKRSDIKWLALASLGILLIVGNLALATLHRSTSKISEEKFLSFVQRATRLEQIPQTTGGQEVISPDAVRVPIFVYHSVRPHYTGESAYQDAYDVTPELFEKHLQYLKDHHYTTISFDTLINHVLRGTPLPPKAVILSLDDAWQNQYTYAFPLLKKYGDTATFFVFTNAAGHKHFLSWPEIKEMDSSGMSIEAHSKSHPFLPEIQDPNTLINEISGSKKILEEQLGHPVNIFAYPFGHYNNRIQELVQQAGFWAARSTYKGTHHGSKDIFALRSILVSDNFDDFVKELSE